MCNNNFAVVIFGIQKCIDFFSCDTNALHITITNDVDLDLTEVQGFVQIEDFSLTDSTVKLSEFLCWSIFKVKED